MTADRINGFSSSASTPAEEYKQARQKIKLIEAQLQLEALQRVQSGRRRIQESQAAWEWIDGYNEVVDRLRGPERDLVLPVSTASDRRYGANWPFWRTLLEHSRLRASARLLHGLSTFAQGAINALTSYTIGAGYTVEVSASEDEQTSNNLLSAVREAVKDFEQENSWGQLQQELFLRSRRDGEYLLRAFDPGDGMLHVRTVGPEHIGEPPGSDPHEWSFGIHTDTEDRQKILGYWVALDGNWGNGEEVSADDLLHVKVNVDAEIKRGLTDFCFDTYDTLKSGQRLIESLAEGSAIQASIALLRQHDQSSATQVSEFVRGLADYSEPIGATSGERNVQRFTPGTIVDAPKGWNFVVPPFASNAQGFVAVVQAVLRSVAVRWNAPEWIISGDASNNNYASSITAESPFVRSCKRWQAFYGAGFERVLWRALRVRCDAGKLRADGRAWEFDELRRVVSVTLNPPTLETRNIQEEASVNTTYLSAGVKSPQTICGELGLDYEKESANLAEHQEKTGGGGSLGGMLGGMGGDDSGVADLFGGSMQEAMIRKKDKLGRNICYDDGKRVSCGPSRDQAGKGKAGESVQGAIAHWRRIYQGGNITPAHVDEFAAALGELSVKELGDLKKRMMVRAGGRKAEMARKIAERLLDGAKKLPPPEEEATLKLKPEPEPEPEPVKQESPPVEPDPAPEPEPAKKKTASVDEYADLLVDTINDGDRGYKAKLWAKGGRTRVYIRDSKGRDVGHIEIEPGGAEVLVNRAKGYFSDLLPDIDIVADDDLEPEVTQKSPQPVAQSKGPEKQPELEPEKERPASDTSSLVSSGALHDHVVSDVEKLLQGSAYSSSEMVPIHVVRKRIAQRFGADAASHDVLDQVIQQLGKQQRLRLVPISDYRDASQEELSDAVPGVMETLFYLKLGPKAGQTPGDAQPVAQSKEPEKQPSTPEPESPARTQERLPPPEGAEGLALRRLWDADPEEFTLDHWSGALARVNRLSGILLRQAASGVGVVPGKGQSDQQIRDAIAAKVRSKYQQDASTGGSSSGDKPPPSTPEQRRKLWDKASRISRDFDSGDSVSLKELRRLAPEMSREQFDRAILDLQASGHVQLNRVEPDRAAQAKEEERQHWVKDEKGNYWASVVGRNEPPQADWQSKENRHVFDDKTKDRAVSEMAKIADNPRGLVSFAELRAKMPDLDKRKFDALFVQMAEAGEVQLQRHNFADSLSDKERDALVEDGNGNYFVGASSPTRKPSSGQSPEPGPAKSATAAGGAHRDILILGRSAGVRQADMRALQSAKTPDEVLAAMAGVDGDFLDNLTDRGVVTHNEVTRIAQRAMAATGSDRARLLDASVKAAERTAKELRANGLSQKADYYEKAVMPYLKSLKQEGGQPATSRTSQSTPVTAERRDDDLLRRIEDHRKKAHANRDYIPIHELRKIVREEQGDDASLNDTLRRMERAGKVRLIAIGDRSRLTAQQLADSIPGENETFAYVEPIESGGSQGPDKHTQTNPPVTAEHRSNLASAFKKLDRNGDNMVSLADLKDETGLDIPTLHAAVQQLMRDGIMSGSGLEGRFGASKRELDAVIHDKSEHGIGYVAVRPERMEDFLKMIGKK